MAKKHWSLLVGLSVVVGVASSLLIKKEKDKSEASLASLKKLYAGKWWFVDQQNKVQHNLDISEDLALLLDGRNFKPKLLEITPEKLVLQDDYGYLLVFSQPQATKITFYDEANDQTYLLEAKKG